MPYQIESKFVIAVASSALFDLKDSDKVFRERGEESYREYQRVHEDDVLEPGVVFPLITRILNVNSESDQEESTVEVILLSKNDPDTGLRVFKSIEHYQLPISRAVFVAGNNPFNYMKAFNASLFLSGNPEDVKEAVEHGYPAGCIYPSDFIDDENDEELRLAFDFDGVIADDSAETAFQRGELSLFHDHEKEKAGIPLPAGPLLQFFTEISNLQKREIEKSQKDSSYQPKIRIAIVTSRNAPAHERVIATLRERNIRVDEAFFLGGIDKARILKIFRPHIFFDDQVGHIEDTARIVPSVHVPFGVANISNDVDSKDSPDI